VSGLDVTTTASPLAAAPSPHPLGPPVKNSAPWSVCPCLTQVRGQEAAAVVWRGGAGAAP
jgi:hypothetical protein